ncbi:hypothetical protein [Streptomyces viridochromogenes]|uniref:hypothetical protein n=1 Tax=Streptomyces viridochromogenes TaxID=1938 RepID=UPI003AF19E61
MGSGDRRYRECIVAAVSGHFRLWLLDAHEPSWQLPYVEGTSLLDTKNLDELPTEAKKVMQRLPVVGVFTYDESLVHAAARLAEALGLPGSAPEAVLACRARRRPGHGSRPRTSRSRPARRSPRPLRPAPRPTRPATPW